LTTPKSSRPSTNDRAYDPGDQQTRSPPLKWPHPETQIDVRPRLAAASHRALA
jgi:hypothetical protein